MEKNNLLKEGVGCEVSKSRSRFSNKFKKEFGFKKVKIVNKNFLDLNLKNNYFDLIIGIDCVINYIGSNPKHIKKLINTCKKSLKKGGCLILEFMTFGREKRMIQQSPKKKYFTWRKLRNKFPHNAQGYKWTISCISKIQGVFICKLIINSWYCFIIFYTASPAK